MITVKVTPEMVDDLERCPCCGSRPNIAFKGVKDQDDDEFTCKSMYIVCPECGMRTSKSTSYEMLKWAWNHRSENYVPMDLKGSPDTLEEYWKSLVNSFQEVDKDMIRMGHVIERLEDWSIVHEPSDEAARRDSNGCDEEDDIDDGFDENLGEALDEDSIFDSDGDDLDEDDSDVDLFDEAYFEGIVDDPRLIKMWVGFLSDNRNFEECSQEWPSGYCLNFPKIECLPIGQQAKKIAEEAEEVVEAAEECFGEGFNSSCNRVLEETLDVVQACETLMRGMFDEDQIDAIADYVVFKNMRRGYYL